MAAYSLNHVIQECLDEKGNSGVSKGKTLVDRKNIYETSWDALNMWIETRLARQKGATVSGFGSFCWEIKATNGINQCRPIFIISDTFVKSYQIKRQRIHQLPHVTTTEEVNYSLLAIKFSKSLTKDMVFSGIRDIIKKIGDFIYRSYEIEIQFSFGVLKSKERKLKFEFNIPRLQQILPENVLSFGETFGINESQLDYIEDGNINNKDPPTARSEFSSTNIPPLDIHSNTLRATNIPAGIIPTLNRGNNNIFDSAPPDSNFYQTQSDENYQYNSTTPTTSDMYQTYQTALNDTGSYGDENDDVSDDLQQLLDTISNKDLAISKTEWRKRATDRVAEQAFLRCLEDVEFSSYLDETAINESRRMQDDWKKGLVDNKKSKTRSVIEMKKALDQQMEVNRKKIEQEKIEDRGSAMNFMMKDPVLEEKMKFERMSMMRKAKESLQEQIRLNAERKDKMRSDLVAKERDYLKQLSLEIDMQNIMKRSDHLEKQRVLLEAWERDGHIRNLKKLQPFGTMIVKDYVQTKFADPMVMTSTSTMALSNPTVGQKLNMSIGYDPRRSQT
eukprot:gene11063-14849_t